VLYLAGMIIRDEKSSDIEAIGAVTKAAFADCRYGEHTEQFIILALRKAGALSVSLVAEDEGCVVGHIAFSPVKIGGRQCGWYGLGPISVLPELQRQGIGKALMREGLERLEAMGAKGCMLVGEPKYYERFGFRNRAGLVLEGVPEENFVALAFGDDEACGAVEFHEGFGANC